MFPQHWIDAVNASAPSLYAWLVAHVPHFQLLAAVLTSALAVYGFQRAWKYSDRKLTTILLNYLKREEVKIHDKKSVVLKRLQQISPKPADASSFDVHADLDKAVALFDKGKVNKAEGLLRSLKLDLTERYQLAERQGQVARQQAAAIHLFLGSIAAGREPPDTQTAIQEFQAAHVLTPSDPDVTKYLGRQYIAVSRYGDAHELFDELLNGASTGTDKPLRAEVLKLKAFAWKKTGNYGNAKNCLKESADLEHEGGDFFRIAAANKRLAKAESRLGNRAKAIATFERAQSAYRIVGDAAAVSDCQQAIENLIADDARSPETPARLPLNGRSADNTPPQ